MSNYVTPLLFVLISIGLISTYIYPGIEAIRVLEEQESLVNTAFEKSKSLASKLEELLGLEASLRAEDLGRLGTLLPTRLDTVRHIVEVDDIARRNHISIQSFGLPGTKSGGKQSEVAVENADTAAAVTSAVLTVSCTGTYEDFRMFLEELETSLSLFDIVALSIDEASLSPDEIKQRDQNTVPQHVGTSNVSTVLSYTLALQTYWLEANDIP